ncbi:dehydration-responsive element-binding protein 1A-like [Fagus crenata]
MNIFSQYSDPHPFDSNTDSFSDSGTSTSARSAVHSDEEVILASRTPKKIAGRKIFKETRHPVYRGLLLSPPPCIGWDDMEGDAQVSLWSF